MRRACLFVLLVSANAAAQALVPPELTGPVEAAYPPGAPRREATVTLSILVDEDGRSTEVKVIAPAGEGFDEAAVDAARRMTWTPATLDGKPVAAEIKFEYRFVPPPEPKAEGRAALVGIVRERGTRKPLAYADIEVRHGDRVAGLATAGADGRFAVRRLVGGAYAVVVAAPRHVRREFAETLVDGEEVEVKYLLDAEGEDPYTTTVEGERRQEIERRTASRDEATRIPGTRGDALRVIEAFPGVARPVFGVGALVVRGSNPLDTTTYIGGHQLPLLYHFGGITSIVNSDLLERIDFLPGNFSARFGRATGGVVDVGFRAPRRDRLGGYLDVSLLDTGFLLEGPVADGSFALAARRSYVDLILSAVLPSDAGLSLTTAPRYWDYQALLDYPVAGGRLSLAAIGSSDKLELILDAPAETDPALRGTIGNSTYVQRILATWTRPLDERTRLFASVAQGTTRLSASVGDTIDIDILQYFQSYRLELVHQLWRRLKLTLGTDGQIYPFSVDARGPRLPAEGEVPTPASAREQLVQSRKDWEWRHGFYWETAFDLGGGITVTPGARVDYYRLLGAWSADPRITARWDFGASTVRAGLGKYSQSPQEFQSDPVFGNPNLRPESAIQASVGYDRDILPGLKAEATLFYKLQQSLTVRDDNLTLRDGKIVTAGYSNDGQGRVIGAELLVRYRGAGPFFGWLAYTLSRAERRNAPTEDYRLFTIDQTHILTLVGSFKLPWGLVGGLRFRFTSGNPVTPIVGSIYDADADVYIPIGGATTSQRLPSYHQLDVRVEKKFTFDSWQLTAYLDVTNVYNRANPEAYTYSYDFRRRQIISGLPIFPAFGVKGEF